jgi:hypothetical protein
MNAVIESGWPKHVRVWLALDLPVYFSYLL